MLSKGLNAEAEGLEFLYNLSHDNPFDEYADDDTKVPIGEGGRFNEPVDDDEPEDEKEPVGDDEERDDDGETVFETGLAVCAGYALLMVALGEYTGDEIVYVSGVSRDNEGDVGGAGHAWNAAEINESWYLLDPTWGAGHVDDQFNRQYNPTYLFTPPEVFINTHFPNERGWQLLSEPMTRGEFMRQPVLRPAFFANGMKLLEPTRSQVRVGTAATLRMENPKGRHLLGHAINADTGSSTDCEVTRGSETVMECPLPRSGTYHVQIFGGKQRYGSFPLWGQIEVHGG